MAKRIREKAIKRNENADKRPSAYVSNVRISTTKVRLVLDVVRGMNAEKAVIVLDNMANFSAEIVKKLILSAMANAEHNLGMDKSELVVKEIYCTMSPIYGKKLNVRGRGKADVILRRGSHIKVILQGPTEA